MTKKYLVNFGEEQLGEPVLADCILETRSRINILRADADGNVLIRFPKEDEKKVLGFLKKKGLRASEQKNVVEYSRDKCVDCGECISLCPTKAFSFDKKVKLIYDEDRCVLCKICIDACPRRALSKPEF
jgi:ferredoxin